jgi:hypothetical protein
VRRTKRSDPKQAFVKRTRDWAARLDVNKGMRVYVRLGRNLLYAFPIEDPVRVTERKNLVLSKQFREALEDAMVRYTNKQLTTAEMLQGPGVRRQESGVSGS